MCVFLFLDPLNGIITFCFFFSIFLLVDTESFDFFTFHSNYLELTVGVCMYFYIFYYCVSVRIK